MASIIDEIERAAAHQLDYEIIAQRVMPIWLVEGPYQCLQLISIKVDPLPLEDTNG